MSSVPLAVDWTFRISDIVAVCGFMGGGIGGAWLLTRNVDKIAIRMQFVESKLDDKAAELTEKIDAQSTEIGRFGQLLELYGRFDERLSAQQRQIDDLKHGRGYIVGVPHERHRSGEE